MNPKTYPQPGDVLVDPEGDVLEVTGITVEFNLNGVATLASLGSWREDSEHDVYANGPFTHGLLPDNFFCNWLAPKSWAVYNPHDRKTTELGGDFEDCVDLAWALERKRLGSSAE